MDLPSRSQVIERFRASGGKIAAVFPYHYPRALLRAHGFLPVEVWGPPGVDRTPADVRLPSYACSMVRAGLAFVLGGGLDVCDLLLVPHGCDSLQGFGSLLLDFVKPKPPVLPFYLPRGNKEAALSFLEGELDALAAKLAVIGGTTPNADELEVALAREEAADRLLARLAAERPGLPLSDRAYYRLVRLREYMPAEVFCEIAEDALSSITEQPAAELPVILSGIVPEPMELLDLISQAGATVVADDLACTGRRLYPAGEGLEPRRRQALSLLNSPPDSTRGSTVDARINHLKGLARKTGAKGIIFYPVKFCEPELFYLPQLRRALEQAGVKTIEIEGELGEKLPQQVITRVEAFLETLT